MTNSAGTLGSVAPRALARAAGFLVLWLVLAGADPGHLVAGLAAAAAATWASLHLMPLGSSRFSPAGLALLALRFLCQSVIAGADVAWRALDPRLPLRTGFVAYPVRFSPGSARNAFATLTSLLPGTVPAGEERGQLVYHCLDVGQSGGSSWRCPWCPCTGASERFALLVRHLVLC